MLPSRERASRGRFGSSRHKKKIRPQSRWVVAAKAETVTSHISTLEAFVVAINEGGPSLICDDLGVVEVVSLSLTCKMLRSRIVNEYLIDRLICLADKYKRCDFNVRRDRVSMRTKGGGVVTCLCWPNM